MIPTLNSSASSHPSLGTRGGLRSWYLCIPSLSRWEAQSPEGLWGPCLSAPSSIFLFIMPPDSKDSPIVGSSTHLVPRIAILMVVIPLPFAKSIYSLHHLGVHRAFEYGREESPMARNEEYRFMCPAVWPRTSRFTPPSPSLLISKTELIILTLPVYGEN